ncbi:Putative ATP-dependent helicase HRQ1 [Auxenochlorella protothecoides]|uniref:Putative ATP-dependent helicase HRQ1 n=1 Tax=Auxenochlorella protothecoides TaxID=3075 RepID=A0A087SUC4_AUXPR|nr:Putative ATP-dependent helicase HRQ1 [Auxenochlorella protothecoides]KFM29328.1 Putative ATP-dependent helicase HRQ1 [Auxenochlorella protothecoides]
MSILIGWESPLDQYFMAQPARLFGRPIEHATIDPAQPMVLEAHAVCAAAELPLVLTPDLDLACFSTALRPVCENLKASGLLGRHPGSAADHSMLHYTGQFSNPAAKIRFRGWSLRAIDPERFAIVNEAAGGTVLEEIEESKAFFEVYDGAVYMYQGRTYLCVKLDLDARVAIVRPADVKYYTAVSDMTEVQVQGGMPSFPAPPAATPPPLDPGVDAKPEEAVHLLSTSATCAPATITMRFLGFKRVWRGSGVVFDRVELFLPDMRFSTDATYIRLPHIVRLSLRDAECDNPYDTRYKPERLLIYDKHPGGIGLCAAAAGLFGQILIRALQLVEACECTSDIGCPCCVQHVSCSQYNTVLSKPGGVLVLQTLIKWEEERAAQTRQLELAREEGA